MAVTWDQETFRHNTYGNANGSGIGSTFAGDVQWWRRLYGKRIVPVLGNITGAQRFLVVGCGLGRLVEALTPAMQDAVLLDCQNRLSRNTPASHVVHSVHVGVDMTVWPPMDLRRGSSPLGLGRLWQTQETAQGSFLSGKGPRLGATRSSLSSG